MRSKKKWESVFDDAYVITNHAYARYCYRFNEEGDYKTISKTIKNQVKSGVVKKETKAYRYIECGDKLYVCSKNDKKLHIITVLTTKMTYKTKKSSLFQWEFKEGRD